MGIKYTNNAYSTLASGITNVATSISVQTGHGARFPTISDSNEYFYCTLADSSNNLEIVKVTARSSDTLTVTRGAEGTTNRTYSSGDRIELRVTAAGLTEFSSPHVKGSDISSAGTITIPDGGSYFHVTGTTTITDIDFATPSNGRWAWLYFDGALTFTHNATTLVLPGGANITTAAGDRALVIQDNADNVVCLEYVRATVPPTRWELIGTTNPSSASEVTFTNLSAYRQLRLSGFLLPATDGAGLTLRTSTNNGSSYDSTANDYINQSTLADASTVSTANSTTATAVNLTNSDVGNAATEGVSFDIKIERFNEAARARFIALVNFSDASTVIKQRHVTSQRAQSSARNALRIAFASGNIASGYVTLEGMRG